MENRGERMDTCNNLVTSMGYVLLNPMATRSGNDDVIFMNVNYDKIELSCDSDEITSIQVPKEFSKTIRTDRQLKAIFKNMKNSNKRNGANKPICVYRNTYTSPDGVQIKKDLVYDDGFTVEQIKVYFNGSIHSGVTIRQYMERCFPNDWHKFRLNYYEVSCDFDVDIKSFVERGLYRSWVRTEERFKDTTYKGSPKSKRRLVSYDKEKERIDKGYDPGRYKYRLEETERLRSKERPLIEDWLSGNWIPNAFRYTYIGNTSIRWEGLNNNEWNSIMRHGVQATAKSQNRSEHSKAKIRRLVKSNQWIPLKKYVSDALYAWTLRYRLEYESSKKYTGVLVRSLTGPSETLSSIMQREQRRKDLMSKNYYRAGKHFIFKDAV